MNQALTLMKKQQQQNNQQQKNNPYEAFSLISSLHKRKWHKKAALRKEKDQWTLVFPTLVFAVYFDHLQVCKPL